MTKTPRVGRMFGVLRRAIEFAADKLRPMDGGAAETALEPAGDAQPGAPVVVRLMYAPVRIVSRQGRPAAELAAVREPLAARG